MSDETTTVHPDGQDATVAGKAQPVAPQAWPAAAPNAPSAPAPKAPAPAAPAAPAAAKDSFGRSFRRFGYRYFGTLFLEDTTKGGKALSFGRTAAIAVLVMCMGSWARHQDVPDGALQTLMALLAYNLGTKGVVIGHAIIAARQAASAPPPPGGGDA